MLIQFISKPNMRASLDIVVELEFRIHGNMIKDIMYEMLSISSSH